MQGNHVIRRSDHYGAVLSSDLIFEQVLMQSVKVNGGLSRGRGFTEAQRALRGLSMRAFTIVTNAFKSLQNKSM